MMLSADTLGHAIPQAAPAMVQRYAEPLATAAARYAIDSPLRLAAFIAQVAHESGYLARSEENLNYSAQGLLRTFPRHFRDDQQAAMYARQPERIANRVYANRLGNGDEASGDGWRYRGRGLLQITGRQGYRECGAALGLDLVSEPDALRVPDFAALSAAWYWSARGINEFADRRDMVAITRCINGGTNGLKQRMAAYADACAALGLAVV